MKYIENVKKGRRKGFGMVSLFKCISTFVNYLMPKKNSSGTI